MSDKLKKTLIGEARILLISIGAGLVFTLLFALITMFYAADAQADVAASILRFHVLAHSDSYADQELKLLVRDAVLDEYHDVLTNVDNRVDSITHLRDELANIERIAADVVADAGYNHDVSAALSNSFFPTRSYGELRLPPGMYDALTIRIGSAVGENWWCVVFPPLCFVDEAQTELSAASREQFASVLSESSYELVSMNNSDNGVRVRFAVVEWWQNRSSDSDSEIFIAQN